eukprot:5485460-Pyramimonas_sp.AAC.2
MPLRALRQRGPLTIDRRPKVDLRAAPAVPPWMRAPNASSDATIEGRSLKVGSGTDASAARAGAHASGVCRGRVRPAMASQLRARVAA